MKYLIVFVFTGLLFAPAMSQTKTLATQLDSVSYCLGLMMGSSIEKAGMEKIEEGSFLQGINDVMGHKETVLSMEQANMLLNRYLTQLNEKKSADNLIEGQKFLAENAKKEGVITLPSGLQYKVIKEGTGSCPVDTSVVTVHYTGTYINGEVFDSSVERGEPVQFGVNQVIPGWTEALKLMKPGASCTLYIPSELAYGSNGQSGIAPNSVLIFTVELLSVK